MHDSSLKRTNKVVLFINWLVDSFLVIGYLVEYFKGGRSLVFVVVFLLIILVPMTWATLRYLHNGDDEKVKFITVAGYGCMYAFAMFTSPRIVIYVYLFPVISMYLLYFDLKFIVNSCAVVTFLNVLRIAYSVFWLGLHDKSVTTDYTIQFASVILYSFSLIVATNLSNKFSSEKMQRIDEEHAKQTEILNDVFKIASVLDRNSKKVHDIVGELVASAESVTGSVAEIERGTKDTAESIRHQSTLTSAIRDTVSDTSELSAKMENISRETVVVVNSGLGIINELNDNASRVNTYGQNAYDTMIDLREKSNEIHGMAELITDISEQTNLLSLNASIESARAGEAGRGFSVVADEIRKLATQSKDSADAITKTLHELRDKSAHSVQAVELLKKVNNEQNQLILRTKTVFDSIIVKMSDVDSNVTLVRNGISEILSSTDQIIDRISNIAQTSEKASVSTQEASVATGYNIERAAGAKLLVEELIQTSTEMQKYVKSET